MHEFKHWGLKSGKPNKEGIGISRKQALITGINEAQQERDT